jgi:hypothetical protein
VGSPLEEITKLIRTVPAVRVRWKVQSGSRLKLTSRIATTPTAATA